MSRKIKNPRTGLHDGETLVISSAGGPVTPFVGVQGGRVFLTNQRFFHEPIFGKTIKEIALDEIESTALSSAGFLLFQLGIIGYFMSCVVIQEKNGIKTKFYCKNAKAMLVAIYEAKKNQSSKA